MKYLKIPKPQSQFHVLGDVTLVTLTKGYIAVIDTVDLPKIVNFTWFASTSRKNYIYAATNLRTENKLRVVRLHQILLGKKQGMVIDHKDHNTLNYRRSNLRYCTNKQNLENRKGPEVDSFSGFRGVTKHTKKKNGKTYVYWASQVCQNEKSFVKLFPFNDSGKMEAMLHAKNTRQQLFTHSEE